MIRFEQVSRRYPPDIAALLDLSFEIGAGELVLVSGRSGAGKTTLLKLIAAIERPDSGKVLVCGQDIGELKSALIPFLRRNLGLVFQDQKLLFDRNVFENAMLPLSIIGCPAKEAARRVRAALDKVGLQKRERALPAELSGGEQQRLAIARAVVHRPGILLADEPTTRLDPASATEIVTIFRDFQQAGVTVLIASHEQGPFAARSPRRLVLERGTLLAEPDSGLSNP